MLSKFSVGAVNFLLVILSRYFPACKIVMMLCAVYLWDKLGYLVCCSEDKKLYICLKTRKMEEEDCLKAQGKRSKITGLKCNKMGHLKPTSDNKFMLP